MRLNHMVHKFLFGLRVRVMVSSATFNNISVILWRSVFIWTIAYRSICYILTYQDLNTIEPNSSVQYWNFISQWCKICKNCAGTSNFFILFYPHCILHLILDHIILEFIYHGGPNLCLFESTYQNHEIFDILTIAWYVILSFVNSVNIQTPDPKDYWLFIYVILSLYTTILIQAIISIIGF
jgi:hypothetical protein